VPGGWVLESGGSGGVRERKGKGREGRGRERRTVRVKDRRFELHLRRRERVFRSERKAGAEIAP